ncbi:enoyl-CoA hydratase-related protein [Dactylosporangium sp. CA-092794]|uniref:enoyl-CoA hydratase-related protein n=1 Tax=Dactylosporangium sp. CA-092794 TaxID=3239929 RepID=UPI003D8C0885
MTQPDQVLVRRHGGTAVLTLNAPRRRNVLSAELVAAVGRAMDEIESDPDARAVVVTGAGPAFCAGAELSTLQAAADGEFDRVRVVYDGFLRILRSPLVTIAAVNGPAVGAGFNLALACDVRLAGDSALFDTRFAQLRIHPGGGHLWLLTRAVGAQRATLAAVFGEQWDAQAALAAGLVAAVHPSDALVAAAVDLGRRLDGQEAAYTRRLVQSTRESLSTLRHAEALARETEAQHWSTGRPAFRQGVADLLAALARRRAG